MILFPTVSLSLPQWVYNIIEQQESFKTTEMRMRFVIKLAEQNMLNGGGPFGAAVFDIITNQLVAPGVNMVVSNGSSVFHAEMVALMIAQNVKKTFDLSAVGLTPCELITSTAPCAMCLGAIPWSGVKRVVCGARDQDARDVGFDEGAKVDDWIGALNQRGIDVITDVCRDEAKNVLLRYKQIGGIIYNGNSTLSK